MSTVTRNPDLVETGNLIRRKREFLGLTQEELAELANVSTDTIHRIESGTTNVKLDIYYRVCDVLGTTPYDCSPSRYKNKEDETDLHLQFIRLSKANQEFLQKHIGEMISHLLTLQGANTTSYR